MRWRSSLRRNRPWIQRQLGNLRGCACRTSTGADSRIEYCAWGYPIATQQLCRYCRFCTILRPGTNLFTQLPWVLYHEYFRGTLHAPAGESELNLQSAVLNVGGGFTFNGYSGNIALNAGDTLDTVTLNGTSGHLMLLSTTPTSVTVDRNTPLSFQASILTTLSAICDACRCSRRLGSSV